MFGVTGNVTENWPCHTLISAAKQKLEMGELFADDFDKLVLEVLDDPNNTLCRADIDLALQQQQEQLKQQDDGDGDGDDDGDSAGDGGDDNLEDNDDVHDDDQNDTIRDWVITITGRERLQQQRQR